MRTVLVLLAAALSASLPHTSRAAAAEAERRAEAGAHARAQRHGFGAKQANSFNIPLVKGTLNKQTRTALLQELRWAQHGLWNEEDDSRPINVQREGDADLDTVRRRRRHHHEHHHRRGGAWRHGSEQGQLRGGLGPDALGPRFAHARAGASAGLTSWISSTANSAIQRFRGLAGGWSGAPHNDGEDITLKAQILTRKRLATYFGAVTIGTGDAKRSFNVLMDTGSCEFWVPSAKCEDDVCKLHTGYDPSGSPSMRMLSTGFTGHDGKQLPDHMSIEYLSGKVEGDLLQDEVGLANLKVPYQTVGVATHIDVPLLKEVKWDGILGLAYPNSDLSREGVTPVFDTIINERLLQRNVFGYFIGPSGGMVTVGDIDTDYIVDGEEIQWAAVINRGYWTLGLKKVDLSYPGGETYSAEVCADEPDGMCRAIVDTGTYLLYGPQDQVQSELRDVQASSCNLLETMPTVTLVLFGGPDKPDVRLTMTPKDYALIFRVPGSGVPEEECDKLAQEHPDADDVDSTRCVKECVSGIAPDRDTIWTLGQVLLRTHYTVFDRDHDRVGFAKSTHTKREKASGAQHGHDGDKGHPDTSKDESGASDGASGEDSKRFASVHAEAKHGAGAEARHAAKAKHGAAAKHAAKAQAQHAAKAQAKHAAKARAKHAAKARANHAAKAQAKHAAGVAAGHAADAAAKAAAKARRVRREEDELLSMAQLSQQDAAGGSGLGGPGLYDFDTPAALGGGMEGADVAAVAGDALDIM